MRKVAVALLLVAPSGLFAAPGRLQGYSHSTGPNGVIVIKEETEWFNEQNPVLDFDPAPRHYIDDDGRDIRFDAPPAGDRYKLAPVFSDQQLYDASRAAKKGMEEEE